MPIDDRTANLNLPKPNVDNILADDVVRLRSALDAIDAEIEARQMALGYTAENSANKGIGNGYASLDAEAKVPASQMPTTDSVSEGAVNKYFTDARARAAQFIATGSVLGLIKVGAGLSISGDGTLSTVGGGGGEGVPAFNELILTPSSNGQTVFTPAGGYEVGEIELYLNGVLLYGNGDDYTASNGTTITLTFGVSTTDLLLLRRWTTSLSFPFSALTSKPTTLAGYGITDAVALSGNQTIAGTKTFSSTIAGSISGNAATATSSPLLSPLAAYTYPASTLPNGYNLGVQTQFVGPGAGEGSWQAYGSVTTIRTYSGGGGTLQLHTPYGPSQGGNSLQMRFGNYDVSGGNSWTAWKVVLASDNFNSYAPTLTGGGASGTWAINVTGNAGTASAANTINATATVFGISSSGVNTSLANKAGPEVTGQGGGGAVWSMHRPGAYGLNAGLDSDNVFRIGGWSASANRFQMDMSGNLTMAGNVTAYSDERLKRNWAGLPADFIERLAAVKHGTYERIDSGERQVGVSAQALRELMPEAVLEDATGTLSVVYGNAALVAAVKLAERVVALEARLAALEGR